ncbi:MAG: hypothetical protein LIO58_08845 [Oscillospiraceae bacterium]|nr:hypothetical protein [Oscillospiraceae bacterium]
MISSDIKNEERAKIEAEKEERDQQSQQTLDEAKADDYLPEDFEAVEAAGGRTFSQEEVNKIVGDRLTKLKEQYKQAAAEMAERLTGAESALLAREQELADREKRFYAAQLLYEEGYDATYDEGLLYLIIGKDPAETRQKFDNFLQYTEQQPEPRNFGNSKKDVLRGTMGLQGGHT